MKNQYFVYPGHGVAVLERTERREVLGTSHEFYSLKILTSDMRVLVPVKNADRVLRPLMDRSTAVRCRAQLSTVRPRPSEALWSRRYRAYMEVLKCGEPLSIARVVAELRSRMPELSFGERKLLTAAEDMIEVEVDLVLSAEAVVSNG